MSTWVTTSSTVDLNYKPQISCVLTSNRPAGNLAEITLNPDPPSISWAGLVFGSVAVVLVGDPSNSTGQGQMTVSFRFTANGYNTNGNPGQAPTVLVTLEDANSNAIGPPNVHVGYFEVQGNESDTQISFQSSFEMNLWPLIGGCNLTFWNGHLHNP